MMRAFKMEWRIGKKMCGWGGVFTIFVNNDLLAAWEFELML
jgi:hypothetical protein